MKSRTGKLTVTMLALAMMAIAISQSPSKAMDYKSLAKTFEIKDQHAVRAAIQQHFEGLAKGDAKMLEAVWDKDAQVRFIGKDKQGKEMVANLPAAGLIKQWTAKPAPDTKGVVMSVDVVDNRMASAKVAIKWNGTTLIDFLTLMKTDGKWRIVSKAFVENLAQLKQPSPYGGLPNLP